MNLRVAAIVAAIILSPSATGVAYAADPPDQGLVVTMTVGPEEVDCVGVAPMRCLQVKIAPGDQWEALYESIDGFQYIPGYTYVLEVREVQIADPPADKSSVEYRLSKIISKTRA